LVTGIFTANIPTAVFAQSTHLKQDINQGATCNTGGGDSPVLNSCNQQSANNVNNGVPTAAKSTGTLLINEICSGPCRVVFSITVTGNNPYPSSFSFTGSGSQLVALGPGSFTITESTPSPFVAFVSGGDCVGIPQTTSSQAQATGIINAGQHLTCNIKNID
jgi:hypothetical protein